MFEINYLKSLLTKDWLKKLEDEFSKEYMLNLIDFLNTELDQNKVIYPPQKEVFSALSYTSLKKVKVVILGQDPYHGEGQAHGLSFSVKKGIKTPPSLRNIYKEITSEYGHKTPEHGYLEYWAKQGVLMLNAVFTVEQANAGAHQKKGWEKFTDRIVEILNNDCENLVFLLWGSHAQKKGAEIDESKHLILKAPHPSPLSAHRGFFGCEHFKKTNKYLKSKNKSEIDWKII